MKEIDINKYWIGYLTGILICINLVSVGVILGYTFNLNWISFICIWLVSLLILKIIYILIRKQEKREKNNEKIE